MAYCTVEDVRDEGVTEEQASAGRLEKLIAKATAYIDLVTGRTFEDPVPVLIVDAAVKLVIRELPLLSDVSGQEEKKRGRILSETTDGHSYTLSEATANASFTGDAEIDGILALYVAPPVVTGV